MKDKKLRELLGVEWNGKDLFVAPRTKYPFGYMQLVEDLVQRIRTLDHKVQHFQQRQDQQFIEIVGLRKQIEKMEGKKHGKTTRTR